MGRVAQMAEYRRRTVINDLKKLLECAERGEVVGVAITWKGIDGDYGEVLSGEYENDPVSALGAMSIFRHELLEHIKEQREKSAV